MAQAYTDLKGVYDGVRKGNTMGYTTGLVLTPKDFSFATGTSIATEADWLTAIVAFKAFPIQDVCEVEDISTDDVVWEGGNGNKKFVSHGKRAMLLRIEYSLDIHKAVTSYNGKNWRAFFHDDEGQVHSTNTSGTIRQGLELSYFRVGKQTFTGADAPAWTIIEVFFKNSRDWDERGKTTPLTWNINELYGNAYVNQVTGTMAVNVFTTTVTDDDEGLDDNTGAAESDVISGLVIGNFEVIDQTGAVITPDSVVEATTTGVYTVTCTTAVMTSGSCQVIPTSTNLYNSAVTTVSA